MNRGSKQNKIRPWGAVLGTPETLSQKIWDFHNFLNSPLKYLSESVIKIVVSVYLDGEVALQKPNLSPILLFFANFCQIWLYESSQTS